MPGFNFIIQARTGSKRFPNKVLRKYKKLTLLDVMFNRLITFAPKENIIIATTKNKSDNKIINWCKKNKLKYFRGSTNNVLSRYYFAAKKYNVQNIIRLTADCPFVDLNVLKKMIKIFNNKKINYLANTYPLPTNFPDGMDIEIFDIKTLKKTFELAKLPSEKEHVTIFMWKSGLFKKKKYNIKKDYSKYRFTVDYRNDFELFKKILNNFYGQLNEVTMYDLVNFVNKNKKLIKYQKKIKRNEGWSSALKKDRLHTKSYGIF